MGEILPTHTPALFDRAVERAAELLRAGEVVALPTETVYGLAANAWNAAAVERIFEIKNRPASNPIIVHVAGLEMARRCVDNWPDSAGKLAAAFWPGPLTIVLPRSERIPDVVAAGGETVGTRWPSHPFIQQVIRACDFPLAAPSANPAGQLSPTRAEHVQSGLGERIQLIVDGGSSHVGIESTVVDLTEAPARLLRPGMIHAESLAAVIGSVATEAPGLVHPDSTVEGREQARVIRSPGRLPKHYAPRAKLALLGWDSDQELTRRLQWIGFNPATTVVVAHTRIPSGNRLGGVCVIPHDPEAFGRAIYAELHRCDEAGAQFIVVEALPDTPAWHALQDRLRRASVS